MLQIIEGPPRCGKSYFAVNYLMKYVDYDGLYNEYTLRPGILVISNIEGLKIRHRSLDEILKTRTIEEFFTIENFELLMDKYKATLVILLIDEFQKLFPDGYKNTSVSFFFQYHGHIGLDIFLMTQGIGTVARWFIPLVEYIVKVTPRTKSILNNFSYKFVDTKGNYLYSKTVRKNPLVFGAYNSFRRDESNKPKNAIWHWIVFITVLLTISIVLLKTGIGLVKARSKTHTVEVVKPDYVNTSSVRIVKPPLIKPVKQSKPVPFVRALSPALPSEWASFPVESYAVVNDIVQVKINGRWYGSSVCRAMDDSQAECRAASVHKAATAVAALKPPLS